MNKECRPTFYTKSGKSIRAGGILFFHEKLGYLMQKVESNGLFEYTDFGGKTDPVDVDIVDTILRELREETNYTLFFSREDIKNKSTVKYLEVSKYLLLIHRVQADFALEIENMGDKELCNHHMRTVEWVKHPFPIHRRLRTVFKSNHSNRSNHNKLSKSNNPSKSTLGENNKAIKSTLGENNKASKSTFGNKNNITS